MSVLCYTNCFIVVKKIIHPNSKISLKKEEQVTYSMTLRRACAKFCSGKAIILHILSAYVA